MIYHFLVHLKMKLLLYFFLACLMLFGCTKDHPPESPSDPNTENRTVHPLNDSLVANYLFLPGTWWVYRDLSDNSLDSIIVTSADFYVSSIYVSYANRTDYYDTYEIKLFGQTHETTRYLLMTDECRLEFSEWEGVTLFGYDENTDSTVSDGNRVAYYDSIQIQNVWYYDVAKTKIYTYYHSCCPIPDLDYYYINKEFGIIKKEIANADSTYKIYELVNKNIVR